MNSRKLVVALIAIAIGLASAAISYELLQLAFSPIEAWYFHKFIEPIDPDRALPPLMWVHVLVLPLVAAIIGGLIATYFYKGKALPSP